MRGPLAIAASRYRAQAPDAQAQQLWLTGLVAPRHVGSSQARARTRVPCIGRQTLNHCATREAPQFLKIRFSVYHWELIKHSAIETQVTFWQKHDLIWKDERNRAGSLDPSLRVTLLSAKGARLLG